MDTALVALLAVLTLVLLAVFGLGIDRWRQRRHAHR